jgi:hypothetical protein
VLDLKLGTTRWAPDSDRTRESHIRNKEDGTLAQQIGLRISGMRVWQAESDSFVQYPKSWGRQLTHVNFADSLALFFAVWPDRSAIYHNVIPKFLAKLEYLLDWSVKQRSLSFFGTSLLMIYDGASFDSVVRCVFRSFSLFIWFFSFIYSFSILFSSYSFSSFFFLFLFVSFSFSSFFSFLFFIFSLMLAFFFSLFLLFLYFFLAFLFAVLFFLGSFLWIDSVD